MPLTKITMDELLAQFDPSVHDALQRIARKPGTTHLVVFENRQIDSSSRGSRTAVRVGPDCTFSSLDFAAAQHLHDLPSQRQYPVAYVDLAAA